MIKKLSLFIFVVLTLGFLVGCYDQKNNLVILQPKSNKVESLKFNEFQIKSKVLYVPATTDTIKWGYLPNLNDRPVANCNQDPILLLIQFLMRGFLRIREETL